MQSLFTKRMDFRISKLNDFKECLAIIGIVCIANVTIIQGRHATAGKSPKAWALPRFWVSIRSYKKETTGQNNLG